MQLKNQLGSYTLERQPKDLKGSLRAWDAADELLLTHVFDLSNDRLKAPLLIINDSFGALATALHKYPLHSWSDSSLAHLASEKNFKANKLKLDYQAIPSSDELKQNYDLVLIKIPKTLALLEDQLYRLKAHIFAGSTIIAAGMSKHIHTSTLKLFEKIIGTTTTSRATKKARLVFVKNDIADVQVSPYPKVIHDKELELTLINHANIFAKDKLDIGTRFLIEQLKHCPTSQHTVDLGCGNGALGIMLARLQAQTYITFIDESYAAIASAKASYLQEKLPAKNTSFHTSDCFNQFENNVEIPIDLILCNPPFHQNHSIGDHIAWQMLKQSHQQLEKNGELWVVGNRHLGYHLKMKKLFGNCKAQAANKKFVVLVSKK